MTIIATICALIFLICIAVLWGSAIYMLIVEGAQSVQYGNYGDAVINFALALLMLSLCGLAFAGPSLAST